MSEGGGVPGWGEYKLLVLDHIERLSLQVRALEGKMDAFRADDISNIKVEVALLKLKAGVWGAVSGAVPAAIAALIWWLSK